MISAFSTAFSAVATIETFREGIRKLYF